jgi:hypothetical protein
VGSNPTPSATPRKGLKFALRILEAHSPQVTNPWGESMTTVLPASVPAWFRIVALLALVWNLFGAAMYLSSVGVFGDQTAGLTEAQRAAAASVPAWVTGAFAIGTFGGVIGSIGLFLRKAWAQPVLLISLLALLVLEGWMVFLSGTVEGSGIVLPIVITVIAVALAWLATDGRKRGWLT